MDPKLAALLERRKKKQEDDGDAGFYNQDDDPPPPKPPRSQAPAPATGNARVPAPEAGAPQAGTGETRDEVRKRMREEARKIKEAAAQSGASAACAGEPASMSYTDILSNIAASSAAAPSAADRLASVDDVQVQFQTPPRGAELQCVTKKPSPSALPSLKRSPAPSRTACTRASSPSHKDGSAASTPGLPPRSSASSPASTPTPAASSETAGADSFVADTSQCAGGGSQHETDSPEVPPPTVPGLQETGERVAASVALFAKLRAEALEATTSPQKTSTSPLPTSARPNGTITKQQLANSDSTAPPATGTNRHGSTNAEEQESPPSKASPKDTIDELLDAYMSTPEVNSEAPQDSRKPQDAAQDEIDPNGCVEFSIQPRVSARLPSLEAATSLPRLNTAQPLSPLVSLPQQPNQSPDNLNRGGTHGTVDQDRGRLLFSVDEESDGDDDGALKADKWQRQSEPVKRNVVGDYELLVAPSQDSWYRAQRTLKASHDQCLSEELEVAVRARGFTWGCVTSTILLSTVRETMRRGKALAFILLLIWSAMYHVSISVCLRQLILWLHNCSKPSSSSVVIVTSDSVSLASADSSTPLANYTSLSQRYTCDWTNRSMQAMINHTFGFAGDFSVEALGRSIEATNDDALRSLALNRGEGIQLALFLLVSLLVQAGSLQASMYVSARSAGEARMRLMSLIYGKALVSSEFCDAEMRDTQGAHSARKLYKLMLEDVDVVVRAEQARPIQWFLPLHCVASVLVMARDILWTNVLVVLVALVCTVMIIFTLSYTIHVTSSRSKHPASSLRVDRIVELLEHYVEVVLLGWQDLFIDAIDDVRDLEHQRLGAQAVIKSITFTWAVIAGPLSIACLLLASAVRVDCRAYFTPGLLLTMCHTSALTTGTAWFVVNFAALCEWQPPLQRIVAFISAQDRATHESNAKESTLLGSVVSEAGVAVKVSGAAFVWRPKVDKRYFRIGMRGRELNLTINKRERVAVIAPKCEGKSSLLCAIAGLMPRERGNVQVAGKVFLCLEHPLLIDGTIQENILFGLPYDQAMYKQALYCSCLDEKLDQWRLRDLTRVSRTKGGMGFNPITGSMSLDAQQRTAIALARAIYADADVYLFDNIFQALGDDCQKAWHRCITEQLFQATVISTFNSPGAAVPILRACDRIAVLGARRFKDPAPGGSVVAEIFDLGSFAELNCRGVDVAAFGKVDSVSDPWEMLIGSIWSYKCDATYVCLASPSGLAADPPTLRENQVTLKQFLGQHISATWLMLAIFVGLPAVCLRASMSYLLLIISTRQLAEDAPKCDNFELPVAFSGCLVFLSMLFYLVSCSMWLRSTLLDMSKRLHASASSALRAAKQVPAGARHLWTGRGIDAMASGMCCLDETFPEHALFSIQLGGCVLSQFLVTYCLTAFTPFKELFIAPFACKLLLVLAVCVGCRMAQTPLDSFLRGRQLVREFIYTTAGALFQVHTIGCVKQFRHSMDALLSTLAVDEFSLTRIKCATGLCVDVIGALMIFATAVVLVLSREELFEDGSVVVGVHLLAGGVQLFFYLHIFINVMLNSIEMAGLKLAPMYHWLGSIQSATNDDERELHAEIPMGMLKISQVTVVHNGVPALCNFDLTLNMREYAAVIGSEGTGKTTLAMCILRALHPASGNIEIGGIDIETVRLSALRKYVGLVGTRPILFKGSLLANLDPAGALQPSEILPLLIAVGLVDRGVRNMPEAMKVVIENSDRVNSTVKQLVCLCRALLRKPQLLILDEFGASIDGRRLRQIDRFLRSQDHFSVLQLSRTFQHVQHCARVFVIDEGRVVEQGKPAELLADDNSRLRCMALELGPAFLNRFRCGIDLWEAELVEKKSLRSTFLEQLEAEWDKADMGELRVPIMSPSSFLRGNTVRGDLHMSDTLPPSEPKTRSGSDRNVSGGELSTSNARNPHADKDKMRSAVQRLGKQDPSFCMQLARSCIAWLHATLCQEHEDEADRAGATAAGELAGARDRVFEALLPHQSLEVEEMVRRCCETHSADIRQCSSGSGVVAQVLVLVLSVLPKPLASDGLARLVNQAYAQGTRQMELIVERILEDDDSSIELLVQLLWLLWSLGRLSEDEASKQRQLAQRLAPVLNVAKPGGGSELEDQAREANLRDALLALLEYGSLLFKERRLWADS